MTQNHYENMICIGLMLNQKNETGGLNGVIPVITKVGCQITLFVGT
jgi:hypothetical protein